MTYAKYRRTLLCAATLAAGLGCTGPAFAAIVKGTVNLPPELKSGRRFFGHWRVENTNVAVQHANSRSETVVVLFGSQFQAMPPKNVPVEISGLQAIPATVVISEGTVVEFKNSDKVSHELAIPGQPRVMPPERLSAGTVRKQRFGSAGEYLVQCTEYPHIVVSVIVTNSPHFSVIDDKGAFKMSDVPEGHATLKVWSGGRWVKEAEVDVPARGLDLTVKVPSASGAVESAEPTKESSE
jgi:plastocyanin